MKDNNDIENNDTDNNDTNNNDTNNNETVEIREYDNPFNELNDSKDANTIAALRYEPGDFTLFQLGAECYQFYRVFENMSLHPINSMNFATLNDPGTVILRRPILSDLTDYKIIGIPATFTDFYGMFPSQIMRNKPPSNDFIKKYRQTTNICNTNTKLNQFM